MDIEKLKTKRQLNVQEQNAVKEHKIQSEAIYWRNGGIPLGLVKVLEDHKINVDKCIVLKYKQDFPGGSTDEGTVVTEDNRFIEFEVDLTSDREQIMELHLWDDITDNIEVNPSARGTGASWGYLALKVLNRLNNGEDSNYRNIDSRYCIRNFMETFQDVFVIIRANPQAKYNTSMLKTFQKYLASVLELSKTSIDMLKKEINTNNNLENGVRKELTSRLHIHSNSGGFKDVEKLKKFAPILNKITQEMIILLEKQEFAQVNGLADAAHNFPEFLITDIWDISEFWKIYIVPYKKRWDKGFLNEWEESIKLLSLYKKKTILRFLKVHLKKLMRFIST